MADDADALLIQQVQQAPEQDGGILHHIRT